MTAPREFSRVARAAALGAALLALLWTAQSGGYGYLWWVAPAGGPHIPSATFKGRVYSAQGAGGHYIVVVPYLNLVVVNRVNTDERRQVSPSQFGHLMQIILDAKR